VSRRFHFLRVDNIAKIDTYTPSGASEFPYQAEKEPRKFEGKSFSNKSMHLNNLIIE
jgi:hypothetical protein